MAQPTDTPPPRRGPHGGLVMLGAFALLFGLSLLAHWMKPTPEREPGEEAPIDTEVSGSR